MSTFTVQENNTFTNNYMPPTRNHLQKSSIHSWQGFRQDFVEGCPNLLEIYVTKSEFVFKTHGIKQCTWYHTWQLNSLLKKKRFFLVLISSLTFGILLILSIFLSGASQKPFNLVCSIARNHDEVKDTIREAADRGITYLCLGVSVRSHSTCNCCI